MRLIQNINSLRAGIKNMRSMTKFAVTLAFLGLFALIFTTVVNAGPGSRYSTGYHTLTIVVPEDFEVDNIVVHKLYGQRTHHNECNYHRARRSAGYSPVWTIDRPQLKGAPVFYTENSTVGYKVFRKRFPGDRTYLVNFVAKVGNVQGARGQVQDWVMRDRGVYLDHNAIMYCTISGLTTRDLVEGALHPLTSVGRPLLDEDRQPLINY